MLQSIRTGVSLPAIALTLTLAGCATSGPRYAAARPNGFAGTVDQSNIGLALRAQQALTNNDIPGGIRLAEQAVSNRPSDAGYRTLLGNAYLAGGRFASAEAAYRDSLSLVPSQDGIALKLVLAVIAQGKSDAALQLIDQARGLIDPADAGLATALAGQPGNAIAQLDEAARAPGADSRVRQNLALAHALAGDWAAARVIASQDLASDQVDARIAQWMTFAKPGQSNAQVASLIGVTPSASDAGMPVRLALRSGDAPKLAYDTAPAPVAVAAPAPEPVVAMAAPVEIAAAPAETLAPAPAVAQAEVSALPLGEAAPPVEVAVAAPPLPAVTLAALRRAPIRASGALPKVSALRRSAAIRFGNARCVVQLGAYGSPQSVKAAWTQMIRRHPALAHYAPVSARFSWASGTVYRLSVRGFTSDREARLTCETLQHKGSGCFVRSFAGDQAVQFASR